MTNRENEISEEDERFLEELRVFKRGDYSIPCQLIPIMDEEENRRANDAVGLTDEVIEAKRMEYRLKYDEYIKSLDD